ncbi:hypothetical protein POTOM_040033 [Populus tomentosa]|uniref:Uncharacterized protein n=1 Tax=Populus tomentosa TaxID=118781 RepID=A0A8X7YSS3_POPTO|nr:hypothetical protein POTOM_040033 [Populus tomentosa]
MRRSPGIGGLQTAAAARLTTDQYRILGESVARLKTDLMKEQLATFRSQLEELPANTRSADEFLCYINELYRLEIKSLDF